MFAKESLNNSRLMRLNSMQSKIVYIINYQYLDPTGTRLSIGGVETYIHNLCQVIAKMGFKTEIYQIANYSFVRKYNGVEVHGLAVKTSSFVKTALSRIPKNEVVIFANDEIVYGKYNGTVINIQHGIGWDHQIHRYRGELFEKIYRLLSLKDDIRRIKNSKAADYVICVDYNYVNWFRTQVNHSNTHFAIIPNFTEIPKEQPLKPPGVVNVIFARRFTSYRGTKIFTAAVKKLLPQYPDLYVTYAGEGPDEIWIREQLKGQKQVTFTRYMSNESLQVHADKHIAVVPSVGSEGTSLSLLEAMASGCAVICTNVGGMTNVVLDHYNGLMVNPTENAIFNALEELINNAELRVAISKRAYDTAKNAFSKEKWEAAWRSILEML